MQDPSAFYAKDIVTILALFLGPLLAVLITLWTQKRSAKRDAKSRLFFTLMAHRKSLPPAYEWVNALNLIDVVYDDEDNVVICWHELYDILTQVPLNTERYNHKYIELLSEMGASLGYKSLQQTDIDKFYAPQALGEQNQMARDVMVQFLRVLKAVPDTTTGPNPPVAQ